MRITLFSLFLLLIGCASRRPLVESQPEVLRLSFNNSTITDTVTIPVSDSLVLVAAESDTVVETKDSVEVEPDTTVDFTQIVEEIEKEHTIVRVRLDSKKKDVTLFSYGRVTIQCADKRITISPGTIRFSSEGLLVRISAHGKSALVTAPCDLSIKQGDKLFTYEKSDYRGTMRLISSTQGLMVINVLPVETYLRGVVPLEIGRIGKSDSAAVQAQAIAARTYTYKRMIEREKWDYDLLPTVSDQVYGGASAEHDGSDRAIVATAGKIMVYNRDLVDALYHSTCGGHTASKEEVWGGVPFPYLKGSPDVMANGSPYCGISPLITWKETWHISDFTRLIRKYSTATPGQPHFDGIVKDVRVIKTTRSGRVSSCQVSGPDGIAVYGGDKIRFVFRRPVQGNGILRSSAFTVSRNGDTIVARGRGYGHGIGMCQTGAIGRARSGHKCQDILSAYYTGISIEDVDDYFRKQQELAGK